MYEIFENQNIQIFLKDNELWFRGKDISLILGYKDTDESIRTNVNDNNKKTYAELQDYHKNNENYKKNNENRTIFINKIGFRQLLQKSQINTSQDIIQKLIKQFNLDLNLIIRRKENEYISNIMDSLSIESFQQFKVGNYRIDLYIPEYKIAIECDEFNHSKYIEEEILRQIYIEETLGCQFIRFNPDEENFNIFKVIQRIYILINTIKEEDVIKKEDDILNIDINNLEIELEKLNI